MIDSQTSGAHDHQHCCYCLPLMCRYSLTGFAAWEKDETPRTCIGGHSFIIRIKKISQWANKKWQGTEYTNCFKLSVCIYERRAEWQHEWSERKHCEWQGGVCFSWGFWPGEMKRWTYRVAQAARLLWPLFCQQIFHRVLHPDSLIHSLRAFCKKHTQ